MSFEPEKVFNKFSYAGQDEEYFDEQEAAIQLLKENICFINFGEGLIVNCSDVFAWACADGEKIENEKEAEELYKLCMKYPNYGGAIWCCIKRNEKPQAPVVKRMKELGEWDISLDKMTDNRYDAYIKKEQNKEVIKNDN